MNMALLYMNCTGVAQDKAEAFNWFKKADAQKVPEAFEAIRAMAEEQYAPAQVEMGLAYENGRGVPKLVSEAVSWYREAALQNNAAGQYNYGRMYAEGKGVVQNAAEAAQWFDKAAKQGHAQAKARLKR
jgi:TPR repeat protein